ncbi:hypothetical protein ACIQ9P_00385 [Kitasatospora sp. NPDC094019]|uniref:hypothetical protein n=1 Tax=Kitasatospora sp. NPDC094019 TaxID=3364091 RepID=UPI00381C5C8E
MRGTTPGDRYRLGEWLGGDSMGDVRLAEDHVLDRRVAVKILKPALLDESGFAERFQRGQQRPMLLGGPSGSSTPSRRPRTGPSTSNRSPPDHSSWPIHRLPRARTTPPSA